MTLAPNPPSRAARHAPRRGFTLIELMVTVAVAGILLAIAAPAMQRVMMKRAVVAQTSELVEAMKFARSEAMKRSGPVTICKVDAPDSHACSTLGATTWQYWFVFAEQPGGANRIGSFDSGEVALRTQSQVSSGVAWQPASPGALAYVTFQSTGIAVPSVANWGGVTSGGGGGAAITAKPGLQASRDNAAAIALYTRTVCVNAQGRVSTVDGNANCP